MKLIKATYEIKEQTPGLQGIYEAIEQAGRTCYKSEDKITEDSAKSFVDRMIKSGHNAMLEHGTVYLKFKRVLCANNPFTKYQVNKYSKVCTVLEEENEDRNLNVISTYVTTNYRVLVENGWLDDLQYLCEPTKYHEKRITVKFTCDRGVSHEFVRHRVFSFAQESTRYCNYSKDKFNNEITFIKPSNWENIDTTHKQDFSDFLEYCEEQYLEFIEQGWTAQQSRQLLPNALKTELVMTGSTSQWEGFFKLRDDSHAHPDAQYLAKPLHEEFRTRGYIRRSRRSL